MNAGFVNNIAQGQAQRDLGLATSRGNTLFTNGVDETITAPARIELGQTFGLKKGVNVFLKVASPIEPSRGINQTSNAGKPEALATGTNQFSCLEKRLFYPRAAEVKRTSSDHTGEKKSKPHVSGQNISPR